MRKTLFFMLLVLFLGAGGAGLKLWTDYTKAGPLSASADIVVPHGNYLSTIHTLQDANVLPKGYYAERFALLAIGLTRKDGQLHAAELHFPAHVSIKQALVVLRHGKPVMHKLTIPEGLSAAQIEALINEDDLLTGTLPHIPEGSVMPETYSYVRNTSRADFLTRTQAAMQQAVAKIWQERAASPEIPDPHALVTLASLIEKETALPDERPLVARVFLNRLQSGMKLQTDPTVIYALTNGGAPLDRPLTHSDLHTPNPYNTYMYAGLPPGPICAPSLSALTAAAHPAEGDVLYFVADGKGGHKFSKTLGDHNKNVSDFRKAQQNSSEK